MKELYYANSFEELAAIKDKKNDDVELGSDLNPGETNNKFVVINGKYAEIADIEHFEGLESFIARNKIKPKVNKVYIWNIYDITITRLAKKIN